MKEGKLITEIRNAVRLGVLQEPFRVNDVRHSVPGFAYRTYAKFLPMHRVGNPGDNTEYFDRVGKGQYALVR